MEFLPSRLHLGELPDDFCIGSLLKEEFDVSLLGSNAKTIGTLFLSGDPLENDESTTWNSH